MHRACMLLSGMLLITDSARTEELKINDTVISIEPMTFYSGERNLFTQWGPRMDCPTYRDRPAGSRDKWIQDLCGDKANQKPIVKQVGATGSGGWCGYKRYAVACVKLQ